MAYEQALLPSTSAAPATLIGSDEHARVRVAKEIALDLEGRRRSITLGGGLLLIPATAGAVLVGSALVGVGGFWLPVCALAGLAIGPALCTAAIAAMNLVGTPLIKARYRTRARELGLGEEQLSCAWREAKAELDAGARARLERGRADRWRESPSPPATE